MRWDEKQKKERKGKERRGEERRGGGGGGGTLVLGEVTPSTEDLFSTGQTTQY
jgi:hypothetical protein